MKIGSLVVCLRSEWFNNEETTPIIKPKKDILYVVRGTHRVHGEAGITLEEIINPPQQFSTGFEEPHFNVVGFREMQPPMEVSIEEILEETQKIEV